jgi:predicted GIY-YIG superfamily endonuclease
MYELISPQDSRFQGDWCCKKRSAAVCWAIMSGVPRQKWFVYILSCSDGSLYTGITTDLPRRCRQHNEGRASRYTRCRLPTRLVFAETVIGRSKALRREAAIKALSRQEKERLLRPITVQTTPQILATDNGQDP